MKRTAAPTATATEPSTSKRVRGDVLKRLRKSAIRVVLKNTDELAQALFDQTIKGNISSGKFLISLIQAADAAQSSPAPKSPQPDPPKPKRSLATEWMNEPEWTKEDEELERAKDKIAAPPELQRPLTTGWACALESTEEEEAGQYPDDKPLIPSTPKRSLATERDNEPEWTEEDETDQQPEDKPVAPASPKRSLAAEWADEPEWTAEEESPVADAPAVPPAPARSYQETFGSKALSPDRTPIPFPVPAPKPAAFYTEEDMNRNSISAPPATPPVARIDHKETVLHGTALTDNYAWLRDKDAPEVRQYLDAENAYADAVTAPLAPLRDNLYNEMLSHIKQTDVSVPFRDGDWWYYSRTEENLQYAIACRKRASDKNETAPAPDAPENVILDGNKLAEGHAFFAIGATDISDDGRWLAYTTDTTGFRQYTLHIKDLETGATLPGTVDRVGSVVWAGVKGWDPQGQASTTSAANETLFYSIEDEEQKRQYQLWRHQLGADHSTDVMVFQEDDERFNLGAGRTRDGKYIVLETASHITSECHVLPANQPTAKFQLIAARQDDHEYSVDHRNGYWFIRTNDKGRYFRLVCARAEAPGPENWTEVIPHREGIMLEDIDLFANFFIACERQDGLPQLRLWTFCAYGPEAARIRDIAFPEPAYSANPHTNRIFDAMQYRYAYQSLVTPSSVFEYDIITGRSTLLKQVEIPGGFDRSLYASERLHATAPDGVLVPISVVYRKDKREPSRNPLYVYGYGSYGYALPLNFNSNRLSLLDRGLVLAYAHIRGGGDLGEPWHDAGKMLLKRNTFTDFIACVEHLTKSGYGDPARVAIEGGSAGGLLMGAVTNLRPDLFRAVLSHVPFVDVMNTMLDASLPLTVPEYEEWGDPNQETYFKYMLSYSPYDNLKAASYPAMLVKTSLFDSQVMYWEPAKYVAKLRTLKTDANPLLLVTNMQAGHGGASGRYDYLKEIAFDYAFLLKELALV